MIYKIIVDKQPKTNPSDEKREYEVDIEELRFKGNVYDSLFITAKEDYVMRRLELTQYNVLNVLPEPRKEIIQDIQVELFEGENYVYLYDPVGNKIVAEYLVENEFNETYVIYSEMNSSIEQSATAIELSVNQKIQRVDGDIEDANSRITQNANAITTEVTRATNAETTLNTRITTTAEGITTEVSKKVGNNEVISKINQSSEAITINANRISLARKNNTNDIR